MEKIALAEQKLKEVNARFSKVAEMTKNLESEKLALDKKMASMAEEKARLDKKMANMSEEKAKLEKLNILVTTGFSTALLTALVSIFGIVYKHKH